MGLVEEEKSGTVVDRPDVPGEVLLDWWDVDDRRGGLAWWLLSLTWNASMPMLESEKSSAILNIMIGDFGGCGQGRTGDDYND